MLKFFAWAIGSGEFTEPLLNINCANDKRKIE
jgi:hypothetical protein